MTTRTGTTTRALAIDALGHVLTRHMHADTALNKLFASREHLRPLDRAFVFEMVYGSLRWLSKMDWILSHMVSRPLQSLDQRVLNALRIGTYQIFYMDRVPDRAAVSETVEAAKLVGAKNASSFVNAILRRVARKAEYFPKPNKETEAAEYLAMHYAHPPWMIERWLRHIPRERLEHMLASHNSQPQITLRVISRNPTPTNEDLATYMLREHGIGSHWRPLKGALVMDKLPNFEKCEAFKKGCYIVQDEAAQLCTSLVGILPNAKVLDACAAPGGKSINLWDAGVEAENLTLCDFSQKRIQLMQQNLDRVGLKNVNVVHGDLASAFPKEKFQRVVLDAPCSSMGVIRRHPEIKWHRSVSDIETCSKEQQRLLTAAANLVEDGGQLAYIVCSQEQEETTHMTQWFLEKFPNFQRVSLDGVVHDYYRKYLNSVDELLVIPGNPDGLDGFFAAVFQKQS